VRDVYTDVSWYLTEKEEEKGKSMFEISRFYNKRRGVKPSLENVAKLKYPMIA